MIILIEFDKLDVKNGLLSLPPTAGAGPLPEFSGSCGGVPLWVGTVASSADIVGRRVVVVQKHSKNT